MRRAFLQIGSATIAALWMGALGALAVSAAAAPPPSPEGRTLYMTMRLRSPLVGTDARLLGLGATGTALGGVADGLLWNPAVLTTLDDLRVSFADAPLVSRLQARSGGIAGGVPLSEFGLTDGGAVGFASWLEGWGPDVPKNRTFALAYASPRRYGLAIGVGLRHERRYLDRATLTAWGFDVGLHLTRRVRRGDVLRVAGSITNLGERFFGGPAGNPDASPVEMRIGSVYELADSTLLATDLTYTSDSLRVAQDRLRWHVGLERSFWNRAVALRVGYNAIPTYDRITYGLWSLGGSLRVAGAEVSYAYLTGTDDFGQPFGPRHLMTVALRWSGAIRPSFGPGSYGPEPLPPLPFVLPKALLEEEDGGDPQPTPTPRASTPPAQPDAPRADTESPSGRFRVLVGSFREPSHADELLSGLDGEGFSAHVEPIDLAGGRWYRVVLGGFEERSNAERVREAVRPYIEAEPIILTRSDE